MDAHLLPGGAWPGQLLSHYRSAAEGTTWPFTTDPCGRGDDG